MKKSIFIASFDMEVGGVERSLASMLNNFDYKSNDIDLFLHSHTGEFLNLLCKEANLLEEILQYKTFRMGIKDIFKAGYYKIGMGRIFGKLKSKIYVKQNKINLENLSEYQYIWKYNLKNIPRIKKEYDIAISYLWPHYFVAEKVEAKTKIAWIHTDYATINVDRIEDLKIWNKYDYIASISEDCTKSLLKFYPTLKDKIILIENITSPNFVKEKSLEKIKFEFSKDYFNIVSVGRLCYAKGFDEGIKALKKLQELGYRNIKWYVIGYGSDEQLLKKLIKENRLEDYFILLGKINNPYPYMKACDLYVQCSRYEGKAVTVSEAQILGKPVLITNYPTAKSQIRDGVDGIICELSPEGIANGIERLYLNRKILQKFEKECNERDFSNSKELEKLYELF